jgi:hypothetical protein
MQSATQFKTHGSWKYAKVLTQFYIKELKICRGAYLSRLTLCDPQISTLIINTQNPISVHNAYFTNKLLPQQVILVNLIYNNRTSHNLSLK